MLPPKTKFEQYHKNFLKNTLVVNLFGQPGAGKSTLAAATFAKIKQERPELNTELVTEYAKQLTWQNRKDDLECQPYVFGKQLNRMWHLRDKVNVIITDSPLLLSAVYANNEWGNGFQNFVCICFSMFRNLNFFINRVKKYNPVGRNQTEAESDIIGKKIKDKLYEFEIRYKEIDGDIKNVDEIISHIDTYFTGYSTLC